MTLIWSVVPGAALDAAHCSVAVSAVEFVYLLVQATAISATDFWGRALWLLFEVVFEIVFHFAIDARFVAR